MPGVKGIVLVLTTVNENFDVRGMAESLVSSRVAACVNVIERVSSIYRWEGRVTTDSEQLLVIKTAEDRVDALREAVLAVHPYEVPEFVVVPVRSVSEAYASWILSSVSPH